VDLENSYVLLRNSWGRGWGTLGDCKISLYDLGALLREQGEACIPSVRNTL
jgi:C1A family cysteine protease